MSMSVAFYQWFLSELLARLRELDLSAVEGVESEELLASSAARHASLAPDGRVTVTRRQSLLMPRPRSELLTLRVNDREYALGDHARAAPIAFLGRRRGMPHVPPPPPPPPPAGLFIANGTDLYGVDPETGEVLNTGTSTKDVMVSVSHPDGAATLEGYGTTVRITVYASDLSVVWAWDSDVTQAHDLSRITSDDEGAVYYARRTGGGGSTEFTVWKANDGELVWSETYDLGSSFNPSFLHLGVGNGVLWVGARQTVVAINAGTSALIGSHTDTFFSEMYAGDGDEAGYYAVGSKRLDGDTYARKFTLSGSSVSAGTPALIRAQEIGWDEDIPSHARVSEGRLAWTGYHGLFTAGFVGVANASDLSVVSYSAFAGEGGDTIHAYHTPVVIGSGVFVGLDASGDEVSRAREHAVSGLALLSEVGPTDTWVWSFIARFGTP